MCLLVSCLAFDAIEVAAQNGIVLRQQETHEDEDELKIGDEITIEIFADLGTVGASGISVFVTILVMEPVKDRIGTRIEIG